MSINDVLNKALSTYQNLNTDALSAVYVETGGIMWRAMDSCMKAGFTREEAFQILLQQMPDFKISIQ